jgi:ribosome production factor 1
MFSSPTSARLQEIGPRFTLKLRWLRKGLPTVGAGDGMAPGGGDPEEGEADLEDDKADEEAAMKDIGKPQKAAPDVQLAALDEEQEYEWKWKVRTLSRARVPLS